MKKKKNIIILGSTGSIGSSALEVIENNSDKFCVKYLSTNTRIDLLLEQARKFKPRGLIITDDYAYREIKSQKLDFEIYSKYDLLEIIVRDDIDIVIAAMVGFAGLESTLELLKAGRRLPLPIKKRLLLLVTLSQKLFKKVVRK